MAKFIPEHTLDYNNDLIRKELETILGTQITLYF